MVSKLSDLLSSVTENRENLRSRYVLQFKGDLSLSSDPGQLSYPVPTKREHELILSYGTIIKKTSGDVPERYFLLVFNAVKRIPYYVTIDIQREALIRITELVRMVIDIAVSIPSKSRDAFAVIREVIQELLADVLSLFSVDA